MERRKRSERAKGLNIIIVGVGKVGSTLVDRLSADDHDITVIDDDPVGLQVITDRYDVSGVLGNGASFAVQQEAGVEEADILIAVTASDELNLLCCMIAKRAGHCEVIARVRTPEYVEEEDYLKEKMGLAMIINPDRQAAGAVARILFTPTALSVDSFAGGHADMIRLKLPEGNKLVGRRIMDFEEELLNSILICAVKRGNKVFIPDGSTMLETGDEIAFITQMRKTRSYLKLMGFPTHHVRSAIVLGGGRGGYYLSHILIQAGVSVTVVEKDARRCMELSTRLPQAVVINGDASNVDQLREVGIETADAVVALTDIDEENILLSLYAKKVTDAKLVTKVNRITFRSVIEDLDLGSVVFPEMLSSEAITAYIRTKAAQMHSDIETLVQLFDEQVEAVEFYVGPDTGVTGVPLSELKLKDQVLITCINRAGEIIIPRGNNMIKPGDTVIVVTTKMNLSDIEDILA